MPSITVEFFKGRDLEAKRKFVDLLTKATVDAFGVSPEIVRIRLVEMERDGLAKNGLLYCDRDKMKK